MIFISYISIIYNYWGENRDKNILYIIYINKHKINNYKNKITTYIFKISKTYYYIISKNINYKNNHKAFIFKYLTRLKAKLKILKKRSKNLKQKIKTRCKSSF